MVKTKNLVLSTLLLLIIFTLSACGDNNNITLTVDANANINTNASATQKVLTSISVTDTNLTTGTETTLVLVANYDDNTSQEITADITWSVNDSQLASISDAGVITADVYISEIIVTATYLGQTATITLLIDPAQNATLNGIVFESGVDISQLEMKDYTVKASYSDGSINENLTVTVQDVTNPQNPTLLIAEQVFSPAASGSSTTQILTIAAADPVPPVTPPAPTPAITAITITGSASIRINESLTLTATDEAGNNISLPADWDSNNRSIVNVNTSGTITAGSIIGTATISAELNGLTSSINVTFTAPDSISSNTATDNLQINQSYNLNVSATYAGSSPIDISADVSWVSADTSIASISDSRLTTFSLAGSTEITGTAYGKTIQQPATIINNSTAPKTLTAITFDATNIAMLPGDTNIPKVKANYDDGTQAYIFQDITWSSDNGAVATVNASSGKITAQAIIESSSSAIITATLNGTSTSVTVTVSQPDSFDYLSYRIGNQQPQSRIENNASFPNVKITSFYSPSGLLLDTPVVPVSGNPVSSQFIIMNSGQEKIAISLAANGIAAPGAFTKTTSIISFIPGTNPSIYYSIDNTTNTSVSVELDSIDASGKTKGRFEAVLCNSAAIANNNCDSALNRMAISGSFAATIEADRTFNCYSQTIPKIIDTYTMNSFQEICLGDNSYYTLNTSPDIQYQVDVRSTDALVTSTIDGITSTATGDVQSFTFTANANSTEIAFNYTDASASTGTTFKLDINALTASAQGTADAPFMFDSSNIIISGNFSVDGETSYYKFPVAQGYSYKLAFITSKSDVSAGDLPYLSATSNANGFNAVTACASETSCTIIDADSDFIYATIKGPTDGYAVGTIRLAYKNDRDPLDNAEALTLTLPVTGFKGQIGDKENARDGTINTLQGSLYWVEGLDVSKNYIVKITGVDKLTQMWANTPGCSQFNPCQVASDGTTPTFAYYVDNHYGGFSISLTTTPNGTKYTLDIIETTDEIYYVSTFANGLTEGSPFDKTGISIFREGDTAAFARSITTPTTFSSVAFNAAPEETIYIKVNDPYNDGNAYSIIVNKTGATPPTGFTPGAPDMFEPGDDVRSGATTLGLNNLDRSTAHHSLIDINNNTGDQDWFKFTPPP